jgi:hypothetical protein
MTPNEAAEYLRVIPLALAKKRWFRSDIPFIRLSRKDDPLSPCRS